MGSAGINMANIVNATCPWLNYCIDKNVIPAKRTTPAWQIDNKILYDNEYFVSNECQVGNQNGNAWTSVSVTQVRAR